MEVDEEEEEVTSKEEISYSVDRVVVPSKIEQADKPFPTYAKFLVSGLAGTSATFCMHPLDFLKTRMQLSGPTTTSKPYKSFVHVFLQIAKTEGPLVVYKGASASLVRQAVYTTTRLGLYSTIFGIFTIDGRRPNLIRKALIGMFSGACGSIFAIPFGLCLVRMMADGGKPPQERLYYTHVFNAVYRIYREENGIKGLYRGGFITFLIALVANGTGLTTYSQTKEVLIDKNITDEGLLLHLIASLFAGFTTSVISSPFDIIKTRIQSQRSGEPKLTIRKAFSVILKDEGPLAFWKGLTPYFMRLAPVAILTFIYLEQFTYWYHIYVLKNKHPTSNL